MPDLTLIATALNGIKTATDIARLLKDSDFSLEKAELKLKLADLVGALADVKMELAEIQDTIIQKDKKIEELENAFQSKGSLVRHSDAYYEADETGSPQGSAYCLKCWEIEHKKRPLIKKAANRHIHLCPACAHEYADWRSQPIKGQPEHDA
ncbi:hypothetical protein I5L51_05810 [Pseudomonas mendocina]|nr:hypothetical protein [Pseudomonas mendocina]MBH3338624.1 hypothetical protein [Pseudomonas mendocina]